MSLLRCSDLVPILLYFKRTLSDFCSKLMPLTKMEVSNSVEYDIMCLMIIASKYCLMDPSNQLSVSITSLQIPAIILISQLLMMAG